MTPKMMDKSTSKIASGAKSTTSHFSKAGIEQTAIWSVNFPKHSKPGPNTVLARPARRLTSNGIPQKRGRKLSSKTALKIHPKRTRNRCLNEVLNEVVNEVLNKVVKNHLGYI
jgi:broad specificity polyphosphatase/5'/3'-nucleotidase SurE